LNQIDKKFMNAAVLRKLGMECGGKNMLLADENGEAVALGEDFDTLTGLHDAGGADVDHLQWAAFQFRFVFDDGAVDLTSVGIAFHGRVEHGKALLRGVADFFCQQDASGTGAEGRLRFHEGLQSVEEAVAGEEFQKCGRFAAGDDEAVDVDQLLGLADEDGFGASVAQGGGVGIEVALNGEDADAWRILCFDGQVPLPLLFRRFLVFNSLQQRGFLFSRIYRCLTGKFLKTNGRFLSHRA
jgi:hypothetical protein